MHAKGDSRFAAQLDSGIRCLETALKKRYACLFIALLFAFGMTNSHAEELASDPPHARSNPDADISRIAGLPEPDDEAVRRIRTGEEWTNPSIAVNADGYDLIVQGEPGETRLNLADLETALLRFQRTASGRPETRFRFAGICKPSKECLNRIVSAWNSGHRLDSLHAAPN
jgi:hypothetical protein